MNESEKTGMISRRNLMLRAGAGILAASLAPTLLQAQDAKAEAISGISPNGALKKLMAGNQRYIQQKRTFPDQARERVVEVAQGQHPFATILACSDSRVAPEIIFDQGLGDLFDIRVAGNFLDDVVLGNIEYATLELGVPLLVILGHERCGAVKAALDGKAVPGHISTLVAAIKPAVDATKNHGGDGWDNAVRANVKMNVNNLKLASPLLAAAVKARKLKVVGARYDLDSGKVEIIA